jgi:DNA-binding transcriptional LysR family regulator
MVGRVSRRPTGVRMSIRALRYLIALAECLNFTRAAERCSVTQSTLSIQLRKLEEYLGVRLFDRDRAHVALTEEGRKVLRFARVAVRAADRIVTVSRHGRVRAVVVGAAPLTEPLIEEINCQRMPID